MFGEKDNCIIIQDDGRKTEVNIIQDGEKKDLGGYNFNKGRAINSFVDECLEQNVDLKINGQKIDANDLAFAVACISSAAINIPSDRNMFTYDKRDPGEPHFVIKQNDLGKQVYNSIPNLSIEEPEFAFSIPANPTTDDFLHITDKSSEMRNLTKETEPNKDYNPDIENNINDSFNKEYTFNEIPVKLFDEMKKELTEEEPLVNDKIVEALATQLNSNIIIEEDVSENAKENDIISYDEDEIITFNNEDEFSSVEDMDLYFDDDLVLY